MMIHKTKIEKHQKERNVVEEWDSVAAVLMGVETVQNLKKDGNTADDLMWTEKIQIGEEIYMIPGMIGFI